MKTYKDLFTALHKSFTKKSSRHYNLSPLAENEHMMWFRVTQLELVESWTTLQAFTEFNYTWMKKDSTFEIAADRGFSIEIIDTVDMEPVLETVNDAD
jgi:hypothetical protein